MPGSVFLIRHTNHFFSVRREDLLNRTVLELNYLSSEERSQYQKEDEEAIRSGGEIHYETSYKTDRGLCSSLYWAKGFVTTGFEQKGLVGVIVDRFFRVFRG